MENLNKNKIVSIVSFSALVLITLFLTCYSVPSGFVANEITLKKIDTNEMQAGMHFKMPFITSVYKTDIKIQTVHYDEAILNKDNNGIIDLQGIGITDKNNLSSTIQLSLQYSIKPEYADVIYKKYGSNYYFKIINPKISEIVKNVAGDVLAEEVSFKREQIGEQIKIEIRKYFETLEEFNFIDVQMKQFLISNVLIRKNEQIQEARILAEQKKMEVLQAQQDLERKKIESQSKVVEAKAEAEANKIKMSSINSNIIQSRELDIKMKELEIQEKSVEKWNGSVPQTVIGNGLQNVPFINLNSK